MRLVIILILVFICFFVLGIAVRSKKWLAWVYCVFTVPAGIYLLAKCWLSGKPFLFAALAAAGAVGIILPLILPQRAFDALGAPGSPRRARGGGSGTGSSGAGSGGGGFGGGSSGGGGASGSW